MPICPDGHDSATEDYCDTCGIKLAGAPPRPGEAAAPEVAARPEADEPELCPQCGTPKTGRFCEQDGYDFLAASLGEQPQALGTAQGPASVERPDPVGQSVAPPASEATGEATVVVVADPAYFDKVRAASGPDADTIRFPAFCPERRFGLRGEQLAIGRHSRSRGISPDIDLVGPPEDPGVSHLHAVLLAQPDGGWAVVDMGSANGTYVNDSTDPIEANTPMSLKSGDHIHLGAWTKLTVQFPSG